MATENWIRRLRERAARAADSLAWYYRTRPDAWRRLLVPGVGAVLTLFLSVAWGLLGPILALVVVGTFAVFVSQLLEELRSLEAEAKADIQLEATDVPWLAGLDEEKPSEPADEPGDLEADEPPPALEPDPPRPVTAHTSEVPALAEQLPAQRAPSPPARSGSHEPVFELRGVLADEHLPRKARPTFLEACDAAFESIEADDPTELEIVRIAGEEEEIVWTYRRSASEAGSERAGSTESLGTKIT